jgi:hypothetical protein
MTGTIRNSGVDATMFDGTGTATRSAADSLHFPHSDTRLILGKEKFRV